MFYDEDAQMEEDYIRYLEMQEQEDWERAIEDEAYNNYILPEYFKALEEEEGCFSQTPLTSDIGL